MTSEGSQGHRACGACVQFTEHFLFDKEEAYVYVCVCVHVPPMQRSMYGCVPPMRRSLVSGRGRKYSGIS